ncbi:hypothetical protein D3H55_02180 [Bacillus salacetis]|uniref:VCBS repeat-containing protein n=1 Tax=Bacillus salacetis TaxID=2315464 RepID=A0A3A1R6B4_9BACI|nr:hypothetical protein [Bacillus salacetis]RIW38368.1 hypothetical protein D3H55_02180 [Bacillus salacetis]
MRKELLFAFAAFFFMSLHAIAGNFAEEHDRPNIMAIVTYEEDVTGDNKKDKITLWGKPFEPGALFYKEIWAEITSEKKEFRIDYEGGYEPQIEFADLNHDGVKDLLESSATGGSGGLYNYSLYTLADYEKKDIGMPPALSMDAHFENDYKGLITFNDTNESFTVDLSGRKEDYDRLGIYQDGKLNEPMEMMVIPYAMFEPVNIRGEKGKGLKGVQRISGAYQADAVGNVYSYWYYENGQWDLKDIQWEEL